MLWLLIELEIHEGGVLHHSSPPPLKGSDISPWRPTACLLLSVHNLMAAVTAQLIHDSPLSSSPITSFRRQFWYTCNNAVLHNESRRSPGCCVKGSGKRGKSEARISLRVTVWFVKGSPSPLRNHSGMGSLDLSEVSWILMRPLLPRGSKKKKKSRL